uniref:Uncharacterized protein n=1 Tax=Anguilla anguilla TaxID=7936 RepID=A0A0E9ULE4_ANGAN
MFVLQLRGNSQPYCPLSCSESGLLQSAVQFYNESTVLWWSGVGTVKSARSFFGSPWIN